MTNQSIKTALKAMVGAAALAVSCQSMADTFITLSQFSATPPGNVNISVSVLDVPSDGAVGAYDIVIRYDATIWSPMEIDFGSFLRGFDPMASIQMYDTSVPGIVVLSEVSLITPLDPQPLGPLQPQSFSFATIQFRTIAAVGTGAFSIESASLYNELGDQMAVTVVPEPAGYAMMLLGLVGIAATRATRRKDASTIA